MQDDPLRVGDTRAASPRLAFTVHPDRCAMTRLPQGAPTPAWASGRFIAMVRLRGEWTVICDESGVPDEIDAERNWRCLEILGDFALDSVGILAEATRPIAAAGISLFAYSTWSSDCLLVRENDLPAAIAALKAAHHTVA